MARADRTFLGPNVRIKDRPSNFGVARVLGVHAIRPLLHLRAQRGTSSAKKPEPREGDQERKRCPASNKPKSRLRIRRTLCDLWSVRIDPSEIENGVFNLAINGRDAMPNGGRLNRRRRSVVAGVVAGLPY